MRDLLLKLFSETSKYYTFDEIKIKLNLKDEQTTELSRELNVLMEEGSLFFSKKGYIKMPSNFVVGTIKINKKGIGTVLANNKEYIIPREHLNNALDNDTVILSNFKRNNAFYNANVHRVIKRNNAKVLYRCIGYGKTAILKPFSINYDIKMNLQNVDYTKFYDGDVIVLEIDKDNNAIVSDIINKNDPDAILKTVAFNHDIEIDFPTEVLEEASKVPDHVLDEEYKKYVDLRDKELFTIDCDTTKDMDDAVGIEILENNHIRLYISIAYVAHYVKEGTLLYKNALSRSTSVYMDDSCIPMLPRNISNGICSLNPNVDRLARTSIIEFDTDGNIVSFEKVNSIINSRMKMKYSEVNKLLDENILLDEYKPYAKSLMILDHIAKSLEEQKVKRGAIEFAQSEPYFIKYGKQIQSIELRESGSAEKLIENLMVLNNKLSAEKYKHMPYLYRVHEKPDDFVVRNIAKILEGAGYHVNYKDIHNPAKFINKTLAEYKDTPVYRAISQLLLEAMKKAKYSNESLGHFALALKHYSHTTSPIRRAIDLVIQTYEDKYDELERNNETLSQSERRKIESMFASFSEYASLKEKNAERAEYDADDIRIAEYAEKLIGQEFEAIIYKIFNNSISICINDRIRGKIMLKDIEGDYFKYNKELRQLYGINSHKQYKIGDVINVTIDNVDTLNGTIKFVSRVPQKVLKK